MRYRAAFVVHVPAIVGALVIVLLRTCHAYELATRLPAGQLTDRAVGAVRIWARMRPGSYPVARWAAEPEYSMRLSARNKINATVTGITKGEATANVTLDAGGIRLVASITVEAADELGLAEGSQVVAIVKASDVIVAIAD